MIEYLVVVAVFVLLAWLFHTKKLSKAWLFAAGISGAAAAFLSRLLRPKKKEKRQQIQKPDAPKEISIDYDYWKEAQEIETEKIRLKQKRRSRNEEKRNVAVDGNTIVVDANELDQLRQGRSPQERVDSLRERLEKQLDARESGREQGD